MEIMPLLQLIRAEKAAHQAKVDSLELAEKALMAMNGSKRTATKARSHHAPKKHVLSTEARKRIAEAQRKRWAAFHKKAA